MPTRSRMRRRSRNRRQRWKSRIPSRNRCPRLRRDRRSARFDRPRRRRLGAASLFDDSDEPLIKLPAAPRAPLAVRRTPETPRLRAVPRPVPRPSRPIESSPSLDFVEDPPPSRRRIDGGGARAHGIAAFDRGRRGGPRKRTVQPALARRVATRPDRRSRPVPRSRGQRPRRASRGGRDRSPPAWRHRRRGRLFHASHDRPDDGGPVDAAGRCRLSRSCCS